MLGTDKTYKLNNGNPFPAFGLGTWQGQVGSKDEAALEESLIYALHNGYRLLDTASVYGVEHVVGRAIRKSGIPRSEITVTTKFWADYHHNPEAALDKSLQELGLDYVDVFLMHWPWATTPEGGILRASESPTFVQTWKLMERLPPGKCKGIGVCNFSVKTLEELLKHAKILPAINQFEMWVLNPAHNLAAYCKSKGIHPMAWGSLGSDSLPAKKHVFGHDIFLDLSKKYKTVPSVIQLSWTVQRGATVIPKTGDHNRLLEQRNLVTPSDADMDIMNNAHKNIELHRICNIHHLLWKEVDGERTMHGWSMVDMGWEDEQGNWLN